MEDSKYKVLIQKPVHEPTGSIYSTPPASSGGTHRPAANNENFDVAAMKHNPDYLHHLAEAMKLVFADRQKYMADTAFVNVPSAGFRARSMQKSLQARSGGTML